MRQRFSVAVESHMRHGVFCEALAQRGWTQRQGAKFLGIDEGKFGRWVNLKEVPGDVSDELEAKLFELTGKLVEDIWPEKVFTEEFLATPKEVEVIRDVPTEFLLRRAGIFSLPPAPDEALERRELKEAVDRVLRQLRPRDERIIRAVFEEEATEEAIGLCVGLDRDTVHMRKQRALRTLRTPECARVLRPFLR